MGAPRWDIQHARYLGECIRAAGDVAIGRVRFSEALGIPVITEPTGRNMLLRFGLPAPSKWLATHPPPAPTADRIFVDKEPEPTPRKPQNDVELERILVVPDCHHPYVDKRAWRTMLAAAREFKPHRIISLGDFGDFYCTSRHRKDPTRERRLEVEVAASNAALDELDALGADHKHFVCGNHSDNLSRYLMDQAPELFNMLNVEGLFRLAERGWTFTPYGKHLRVGKVFYAHDPSGCGSQAHVRASNKYGHSIVHGHTHRAAVSYSGDALGTKRVAIMSGWLGDAESATYTHDISKEHEWMHSFTLGWMEPSGVTHFQLVPIIDGRACVNGKLVAA